LGKGCLNPEWRELKIQQAGKLRAFHVASETWAFAIWGIYGYGFSFEEPVVIGARKVKVTVTWRGFGWKLQSLMTY
jgi:hypothetical protein